MNLSMECEHDPADLSDAKVEKAEAQAQEFDRQRNCSWNYDHLRLDRNAPDFSALKVPRYASLGGQCWGTLEELALLHTLRPCKDCGSTILYKSNFQIACCSCFGEDECENRDVDEADAAEDAANGVTETPEEGCHNCAENMNLRDAITRWNILYGDNGERGRVEVVG